MKKLRQKAEKALLFLSYMGVFVMALFVMLAIAAGINQLAEMLF